MENISNWLKRAIKVFKVELEDEIRSIYKIMGELKTAVALITQDKKNDKETVNELKKDMEALTIALNRLNLTLENKAGIAEGKSIIMKIVWTIFGSLIFAWVIWNTTATAKSSTELQVLKKQIEKINGIK